MTITATGHICYLRNTALIVGLGSTPEAADADARAHLTGQGVELVDEAPEYVYGEDRDGPAPVVVDDLVTCPATAGVIEGGCDDHWTEVDGIACTHDEATAHQYPDDEAEAA